MPSRLNHIKIVCPNPHIVNAFLTQVCDIPEGWPLGGDTPRIVGQPLPLWVWWASGIALLAAILLAGWYVGRRTRDQR